MHFYFLRHGIAVDKDDPRVGSDAERFLTPKGVKRMRKAAKGIRRLKIPFDAVLCSPAARARQTAEIVAAELGLEERLQEISGLSPESTVDVLLFGLTRFQNCAHILLVGHEPLLTDTIAFMLTARKQESLNLVLKKGGLCQVEVDRLPPSEGGALRCWLTPQQLRALAGAGSA